jgi:hypothetical protein
MQQEGKMSAKKVETVEKFEVAQINIRIRKTTKFDLEQEAEIDRRSMADQADVLIAEAIAARKSKRGSK